MIHSIFRIFRKTVPLSFQGVGEKGKKGVQIGLFIFYTQELTASKTTHPKEILTGIPKNPKVSFLEYIYIYTGIRVYTNWQLLESRKPQGSHSYILLTGRGRGGVRGIFLGL